MSSTQCTHVCTHLYGVLACAIEIKKHCKYLLVSWPYAVMPTGSWRKHEEATPGHAASYPKPHPLKTRA